MNVSHVLADKDRDVLTVFPNCSLLDVVDVLAAEAVGALVVVDDRGALVGIISERDIVRAVAAGGSNALDRLVSDHMTRHVVTATLDESIVGVLKTMSAGRFRHVPILKDGRLVGIVSSGDVIKHRLRSLESEQTAFREYIATA